jgi:RNA polymerase sigma-70 factor, ECF subfamily
MSECLSDQEVVDLVMSGRREAYGLLVDRYAPLVFSIVAAHVPAERQHEVAQEVFVQAYLGLGALRSAGSIKGWLSTIAAHRCCDFWRRRRRRSSLFALLPHPPTPARASA